MSTASLQMGSVIEDEEELHYRAIHIGVVIGFTLAALVLIFAVIAAGSSPEACIGISFLNLLPMVFCLWALLRIREEPERFTGRQPALIAACTAMICFIAGLGYGIYARAAEVPDGYTRLSFNIMKPDELQERGGVAVPPDVAALEGKKVFIKGYIRPDSITVPKGIHQFLLVRDNNTCCFGALSKIKYHDQILVTMVGDHQVDYSQGVIRIGGVLHIEPQYAFAGAPKPVFSMKADYSN